MQIFSARFLRAVASLFGEGALHIRRLMPLVFLPIFAWAQTGVTSTPSTLPRVAAGAEPTGMPTYELALKWNDRWSGGVLLVPLKNDSDKPLNILGVQATSGLFVGDFPATIAPRKEDTIGFVYNTADNTESESDIIRVLTDDGVKQILVKHVREPLVQFSARRLTWAVAEAATAKSIEVSVASNVTMPKAVRTTKGNTATLEFPSAGQYRIRVTPGSTSEAQVFPVFVDFDPALPGGSVIITGVIEKK
jgi:hypothetical protein